MEERENEGINGRRVWNLFDILGRYFGRRYFGNLVEGKKERKIEKRKKEKNLINEDIFLISKNENIGNTGSWV